MGYILITNQYPKEADLYKNAFIHRRIKNYYLYRPYLNLKVFVINPNKVKKNEYMFDGVLVQEGNEKMLKETIMKENPDKLLLHFINRQMMDVINQVNYKKPVLIWIHGAEALGWYRRLFNFNLRGFYKYVLSNTRQLINFRSFIKKNNKILHFIFVSEWMKKVFETDARVKVDSYSIIPNIIDKKLFDYSEKSIDLRKKILLIRPFSSKKYANDIAMDSILKLSKWRNFSELEFIIVGSGKDYYKLTDCLKEFPNIKLINNFVKQDEMSSLHKESGIFLCPTRQDAQGVSMCEAMSSGLVPITSDNTAIPEFVENNKTGFLTKNSNEIANAIIKVYEKPQLFSEISSNASNYIEMKCGIEQTILRELELIND